LRNRKHGINPARARLGKFPLDRVLLLVLYRLEIAKSYNAKRRTVVQNPFTIEVAVGAGSLVNRSHELSVVKNTVLNGSKLFVIGPRRFGKTSIILTAAEQLRAEGGVVLDYNIEGYTSIELLVRALVSDAARIASSLSQAAKSLRQFFGTLQPSVTASVDGTISASLGIKASEAHEQAPLLIDALNSLEKLAANSKRKVGVVFDEFQHLLRLGGAGIEGQLRAAIQTHKHIGYVFAGSQTSLISDMVTNPARPFYRLGENLFIGEIPRAEFLAFMKDSFQQIKCKAEGEAMTAILTLAEDVPYNIQALARACWEESKNAPAKVLTEAMVVALHQRLIRGNAPIYAPFWAGLTTIQQKALAAVAHTNGQQLLTRPVLKRYDLSPGSMQKALQSLENFSMIRRDYQTGALTYRFEDPFFKAWILSATVTS
jgi:hypothetical protein